MWAEPQQYSGEERRSPWAVGLCAAIQVLWPVHPSRRCPGPVLGEVAVLMDLRRCLTGYWLADVFLFFFFTFVLFLTFT